jgi:hypothetical protein
MNYINEKNENSFSFSLKSPKSSYKIDYNVEFNNIEIPNCILGINFISENLNLNPISHLLKINFYSLIIDKKSLITVYIQNKSIKFDENKETILFFHDNKNDLGNLINFLIDFSLQFKSDVICYDYFGYGKSEGENSIKNFLNLNAIKDFIFKKNIKINNLILIGHNIGSILAIKLANENEFKKIKCLILISPVFYKNFNSEIVNNLICNIFLIQSKINLNFYLNIKNLFKNCQNFFEWANKSQNDENLFLNYRQKFIMKIKNFIESVNKKNNLLNLSLSQILSNANTNSSSGKLANKILENSLNEKKCSPINNNIINNNENENEIVNTFKDNVFSEYNNNYIKNDENFICDYNEYE